MKRSLLVLLLCPLFAAAQDPLARYQNDTLYTASGYKIFIGQTLEFAKGTREDGRFWFVKPKNGFLSRSLTNRSVIVTEIKKVTFSLLDNGYVDLIGYLIRQDDSREVIVLHISFDRAIENSPDLPSELIVPDEFRNTRKRNIPDEIRRLYFLRKEGVITKAEYTALKKKLSALQTPMQ